MVNEVLASAKEKVQSEINVTKKHDFAEFVEFIGEFLLQHLEANPEHAEHILVGDKTILKSVEYMRSIAEKKKTKNFAMIGPKKGCEIVLEYFGIKQASIELEVQLPAVTIPEPTVVRKKFSVSLDDLL